MRPIKFEILKETWYTWELPDKILLRLRPQLVWAIDDQTPDGEGAIRSSLGIGAISPPELLGDPTEGGPNIAGVKPAQEYDAKDLKLLELGESLYKLESGSIVSLSVAIRKIRRFQVYDQQREPVVQALTITEVIVQMDPRKAMEAREESAAESRL